MTLFVDSFEEMLEVAELGKTNVQFGFFDFGRIIGAAVETPDGKRFAAQVKFSEGWEGRLLTALMEARP